MAEKREKMAVTLMKFTPSITSEIVGTATLAMIAENQAEGHQLTALKGFFKYAGVETHEWNDMEGQSGLTVFLKLAAESSP